MPTPLPRRKRSGAPVASLPGRRRPLQRLHELRRQSNRRDQLLLKLGSAKKEAGRAWHLVDIRVPETGKPVTSETFTFALRRDRLRQRLVVRHHLTGLDRDELDHYLTHRLRLAGCEIPLFEPPAIEALFQSARGLPRLINRIAHYALTAAAVNDARTVNAGHLEHAVAELRL